MRILFTFAGVSGHADPLVPIARAAQDAGHVVAFAGRRSGAAIAEANGFTLFATPGDDTATGNDATITPLLALDMERERRVLRTFFAGSEARSRATHISELIASWHPEVVVCDEVDFGAMIATERLKVPRATVLVTASGSFVTNDVVAEPLGTLRAEHGLPPDPEMTMLRRDLVVSPFPPSFRDPAFPLPQNATSIHPDPAPATRQGDIPPWVTESSDRQTVYFTLGSVFNSESGDLFQRVLSGLHPLPIELIVTVGRDIDPERFGPQPDHIHIARYIPQSSVLPLCDLVVNHGGSGTVIGALTHGLPMVLLPMGADQSLNADRCEQLGVGITFDAVTASPGAIADAVDHVLGAGHFRLAAEALRDEIATLPGPAAVVPLLERHTGGGQVEGPA